MVKEFSLRMLLPDMARGIQQVDGPDHIGEHKFGGIGDGTIHMRFSSQVDHPLKTVLLKELLNKIPVDDVTPDKGVMRQVLHVLQISQVTCISQLIKVHHPVTRILVYKQPNHMGTNESGASGDQ